MEINQRIQYLFSRYTEGKINDAEFDELLVWLYNIDEEQADMLAASQRALWAKAKTGEFIFSPETVDWDKMLQQILENKSKVLPLQPARIPWMRIAAAAIIIFLAGTAYFYLHKKNAKETAIVQKPVIRSPEKVLPNTNQTTLTLGDGRQIILDSAANGNIAQTSGVAVRKLQNGEIAYTNANSPNTPEYHIINVPRGGRPYQLLLSDGSKIWLNAASSLRYPSFFTGDTRTVELTGEAYFEVAKDAFKPFHVQYKNMDVEVLGTHFDIMAYEDEPAVQTTLLEGAVKVSVGGKTAMLTPGKQARLAMNGELSIITADTELAVAWVKGYFQFDKSDVKTILREVSRWYNLDIEYKGTVSTDLFSGKIERSLPLSAIVKLLSSGNIKLQVEGNKLVVE